MRATRKRDRRPALAVLLAVAIAGLAQGIKSVTLPAPQVEGGKPLMQALKARQTLREFSPERLPLRVLSNLLWAGFGVNRPDSGKRTAPSALNAQEVDLYAATSEGLYLYRAQDHTLQLVLAEDIRPKTGPQPFVTNAPLSLIYVADLGRLAKAKPADRDRYALLDAGFIIQNVYLYCASEDLACVVHDLDREALAQTMKLGPEQKVILAHAIGFPKK